MALKHKHLILSLEVKYPPASASEVESFQSFLIHRIGMQIAKADTLLKNPHAYYCDHAGNRGVTGVGILETSHTALHVWDEEYPAKFEMDLYSCSDFDVKDILALCNTFGIIRGNYYILDRDGGLKITDQGEVGLDGVSQGNCEVSGRLNCGLKSGSLSGGLAGLLEKGKAPQEWKDEELKGINSAPRY